MKNRLHIALGIVLAAQSIVCFADSAHEPSPNVYYVTPDNKTIEYRNAFTRTYTETETIYHQTHIGTADDFPILKGNLHDGNSTTRQIQKTRHYGAGFYYKNSDVEYDIPVGQNIIYSLVKSPTGEVQRLVVWKILQGKMTQKRINRDCVEVNDRWLSNTALCSLLSGLTTGLFGRYVLSADDKYTAACALAGLVGGGIIGGYSNSGEKRWADFEYMTDKSRNLLLQKMIAAGDKRASWVQNTSLLVVDVLEVRAEKRRGKAHIEHFAIKPATHDDVAKMQENNYGEQGSIAYDLDGRIMKYAMTNDEHGLTFAARLKCVLGWEKSA